MSRAMNLHGWDEVWSALECGHAYGAPENPKWSPVARAMDDLEEAFAGRITAQQLGAIANLVEKALGAAARSGGGA